MFFSAEDACRANIVFQTCCPMLSVKPTIGWGVNLSVDAGDFRSGIDTMGPYGKSWLLILLLILELFTSSIFEHYEGT